MDVFIKTLMIKIRFILLLLIGPILFGCDSGPSYQQNSIGQETLPVSSITIEDTLSSPGSNVILDGRASRDPNGENLSYNWSFINKPVGSQTEIINENNIVASFIPDVIGEYIVQLLVNNGSNISTPSTITISVITNRRPIANAGDDRSINVESAIALDGSYSSDPDNDSLNYQWRFVSKPSGNFAIFNNANYAIPQFYTSSAGEYVIELIVNDGEFDSLPDTITITAISSNTRPIANAGPDVAANTLNIVHLNGGGSFDADNDALSFNWQVTGKPLSSSVSLTDADTVSPSFTPDIDGVYIIQLTVHDGIQDSITDTINIASSTAVGGNIPPIANAGSNKTSAINTNIILTSDNSTDADMDAISYLWSFTSRPAGSNTVLNNASSSIANFTPDITGNYIIQLIVNDGQINSNPDFVSVSVFDPNTPPVANAGIDNTVAIDNFITLDGSASADADGDSINFSWSLLLKPENSNVSLNNTSIYNPGFTPDLAGNYVIQLIVNDGKSDSVPNNVVINAFKNNTPPVANAGSDFTVPVGTTASLDGRTSSDADLDSISFLWSFDSVPNGSTAALSSISSSQISFVPDELGDYTIKLVVNDGTEDSQPDFITVSTTASCESQKPRFLQDTWPVLRDNCLSCHQSSGVTSPFNLVNENVTDFNNINFSIFKTINTKKDANSISLILTKASNSNSDHSGGQRFTSTDSRYSTLADMVTRLDSCIAAEQGQTGIIPLSNYERLRKVTLALAGRLPTTAEENQISSQTNNTALESSFNNIIDTLLTEDKFYDRLTEIFNDVLLTNAFPNLDLADFLKNFNNDYVFATNTLINKGYSQNDIDLIRQYASQGQERAPVELISHVVRQNRPFTEILTAPYVMVNAYSATMLDLSFIDGFEFIHGDIVAANDPNIYREAVLVDIDNQTFPHSGVFTTLAFMARYPTSRTNRNRARAKQVYRLFLDTDVEGLADRSGLDLNNQIGLFPTYEDPQCKQCHDVFDPIAGLFKNWNGKGHYLGNANWFNQRNPQEMLSPGYTDLPVDLLPTAQSDRALQWMSERIAADNRFALSIVKTIFVGLTGRDANADEIVKIETYKTDFISSNFNLKSLIKNIINDSIFHYGNLASSENALLYVDSGTARILSPEQLHRKIQAIFGGYKWTSPTDKDLLDLDSYLLLYGGIDSINITVRNTDATSLKKGIQERIAYQTSCDNVPADFNRNVTNRILFPLVDITDTPNTTTGQNKIKLNIQHLHKLLLGEVIDLNNIEIRRTYDLFVAALAATAGNNIPGACQGSIGNTNPIRVDANYTVRSWMAVVSYLLNDYKFLYE